MDWAQLEKDFRVRVNDLVQGYFFTTEQVITWLKEAEEEACIRGRLLHESDNPAVCEIGIAAGVSSYPLHRSLYEITHCSFQAGGRREPVLLKSTEDLDRIMPDWRERTGTPRYAVQTDTAIRLAPRPDKAGTLSLEGYRLPLNPDRSRPEIHQAHHLNLVHWALYRALSLPDAETLDLGSANEAEARFAQYFGLRPDSDLRRITRHDEPQGNRAHWA